MKKERIPSKAIITAALGILFCILIIAGFLIAMDNMSAYYLRVIEIAIYERDDYINKYDTNGYCLAPLWNIDITNTVNIANEIAKVQVKRDLDYKYINKEMPIGFNIYMIGDFKLKEIELFLERREYSEKEENGWISKELDNTTQLFIPMTINTTGQFDQYYVTSPTIAILNINDRNINRINEFIGRYDNNVELSVVMNASYQAVNIKAISNILQEGLLRYDYRIVTEQRLFEGIKKGNNPYGDYTLYEKKLSEKNGFNRNIRFSWRNKTPGYLDDGDKGKGYYIECKNDERIDTTMRYYSIGARWINYLVGIFGIAIISILFAPLIGYIRKKHIKKGHA